MLASENKKGEPKPAFLVWPGDRGRTAVLLLRAFRRHPGNHPPHRCAVNSCPAVGRPPGAIPGPWRLIGSARPLRGSSHLAAPRPGAKRLNESSVPPPSGFYPAPQSDPAMPAPNERCTALPRFRAPTAQPFRDEPPLPESFLLRVTLRPRRSCRPRRLAPAAISLVSPPGALPGFLPPGLHPPGIGTPLDVRLPSGDWLPHALAHGASLQGFHPPDRLDGRVGVSPSRATRPSWAFSSLGLSPLPASDRRLPGPHPSPRRGSCAAVRRSSSPAFRDSPVSGSVPSAPEYQRTVESACLFRGCRPLRGFRPRPPCVLLFTQRRAVSDQLSDSVSEPRGRIGRLPKPGNRRHPGVRVAL
jgi:hypothetical protein